MRESRKNKQGIRLSTRDVVNSSCNDGKVQGRVRMYRTHEFPEMAAVNFDAEYGESPLVL